MVNWPPDNSFRPQPMGPSQNVQRTPAGPAPAAKPVTPPASEPAAPAPVTEPTSTDTSEVRGISDGFNPQSVEFGQTSEAAAAQATEAVGASSSTSDAAERCEVLGRACQDLFTNGPKPEIVQGLSTEQRKEFEEAMFEALLFAHAEVKR